MEKLTVPDIKTLITIFRIKYKLDHSAKNKKSLLAELAKVPANEVQKELKNLREKQAKIFQENKMHDEESMRNAIEESEKSCKHLRTIYEQLALEFIE